MRKSHHHTTLATLLGITAALVIQPVSAKDWPQWRGPNRDGVSQEAGLLKEWPAGGPKLVWQQKEIGSGYATPAVVGDRLYVISNKGMDDEYVLALNVKDGKTIWSTAIGKVGPNQGPQYPGARSTPTIKREVLYAFGSDGDLACLETATGKVRWTKNVRSEFGGKTGNWAYCESLIVDGDAVYCSPGGTDATVVALNKKTGELIWKCAVPEGDQAGNASPILVEVGGTKQYVQPMGKGVMGVDVKTGKFLWRFDKTPGGIPTPVAFGDSIYCAGGRSGGGVVKLKINGGAVETEQLYFSAKMPTAIGGTVKVGDYLYGAGGQGMMCVQFATGETKWQERGIGVGSVCVAEGRLYVHGEEGDVALVEATSEGYREKGRFTPPEQPARGGRTKAWAYPVVSNGKLYIRDQNSLWCYDVQAAK